MSHKVIEIATIKTGRGAKGPWVLREVTLEGTDKKARGFDAVIPGDEVELTEVQNGEYTNTNYKKVKVGGGVSPTAVTGGAVETSLAKKQLALLTLIAEQLGVSKELILEVMEK